MSHMSRTRRFFLNSVLLISVSLLMRGVGVVFNVYVTNKAGAEVVGLFSLLSGAYGFAITLATSGINLAMTRTVSEALGENNPAGAKRAVKSGILYSLVFGVFAGILLFALAEPLGADLIGDSRTVMSLRVLALTLPPIAICSCLCGYFTAVRRVSRNAASQIISQGVRIVLTVFLLSLMLPDGIEYACLALVIGGAAAEFIALIITVLLYLIDRKRLFRNNPKGNTTGITKKLIGISLPVAFSAYLRSGLVTVEHILIPRGLKKSGATWKQALSSFGILHSLVLPVVLFPSAFISSFSGLLIPEIAESRVTGNSERIIRISFRIFTLAMIFSIGTSGVMICYSEELGAILSSGGNAEEAARFIRYLAPLIPVMYVDSSVDAILKGMGEQIYSMNVNIIDALLSVILVWILIPPLGLYGYIITIYATEIINTTLSITRMLSVTGMKPNLRRQVFGPIACIIGSTCMTRLIFQPIADHGTISAGPSWLSFSLHTASTVIIYIALTSATGILGSDEREVLGVIFGKRHKDALPAKSTAP